MDRQEIFTKVATHLLTQNEKAVVIVSGDPSCKYLAPNGNKCAVGCLIPTELYTPEIEGAVPLHVADPTASLSLRHFDTDKYAKLHKILTTVGVRDEDMPFLRELQRVHDDYSPDEWRERLQHKAAEYGLVMPEVA